MEKKLEKKEKKGKSKKSLFVFLLAFLLIGFFGFVVAAPIGPGDSNVNISSNETYSSGTTDTGTLLNISGGYLAKLNVSSVIQNTRWKAFVGWIDNELVLRDASGDQIFDWSLTVTSGKVYATRHSGSVSWSGIGCSNNSFIENENSLLSHSSETDNITATFNDSTHNPFSVGSIDIGADSCPTLNTYTGNTTQDTDFEEMVLDDGSNLVYATLAEDDLAGYDGQEYDFQMLVPQNASTDSANTPYYMYVEVV